MIKQNESRVYMLVIYLINVIDLVVFCVFDVANIHISVVLVEIASIIGKTTKKAGRKILLTSTLEVPSTRWSAAFCSGSPRNVWVS